MGGRRRHLLNINSANSILRNAEERMAINMPIQGTAADMIKMAMVVIVDKIKLKQMRSTLLLQVHDELVFEMALDEEEELKILFCRVCARYCPCLIGYQLRLKLALPIIG